MKRKILFLGIILITIPIVLGYLRFRQCNNLTDLSKITETIQYPNSTDRRIESSNGGINSAPSSTIYFHTSDEFSLIENYLRSSLSSDGWIEQIRPDGVPLRHFNKKIVDSEYAISFGTRKNEILIRLSRSKPDGCGIIL